MKRAITAEKAGPTTSPEGTPSIAQFQTPEHLHNLVHYAASLQATFDLYRSILERVLPTMHQQDQLRLRTALKSPETMANAIAQTYGEYAERCAQINMAFGQDYMQQQGLPPTEGGLAVLSSRIAADLCPDKGGN